MINFWHELPRDIRIVDREAFLLERCRGKTVLHLGCTDSDLTVEKLKQGTFLHAKLSQVSQQVIGVDIDAKGLEVMRAWGFRDLIQWDVQEIHTLALPLPRKIDVIVAGELLEHLVNPGIFLEHAKAFLRAHDARMIITTPNAFSWRFFFSLFRKAELVHPDHNFYFSYITLLNLLRDKFAYEIVETCVYAYPPTGFSSILNYYRSRSQQKQIAQAMLDEPVQETSFKSFFRRVRWHGSFITTTVTNCILLRVTPFFADGLIFVVR